MADAWQRHRFLEGIARALLAVGRPTLLVLDNMQWCDQETLAFITFCLGLADGAPLLVAATLRDDGLDADPELVSWLVRMRATGLLTELSLTPLDAASTAHLAQAISGRRLQEADTNLLHATTGGFPLYVIEAVRGTDDAGGAPLSAGDLAAVLHKRLEQTTGSASEVAGLAAAVGTNFSLDLLTEASDLEADAVVEAVDELWRRRIMREFGDGYDFSHDLLREAAYEAVSPPKRWLLHRRIAQGSNCCTPGTPTRSRRSSPSSMPAAGGPSGHWPIIGGRPRSRRPCSPTPRPYGCTRRRCRSSRRCRPDASGTPGN
jgi:predicted ATPase